MFYVKHSRKEAHRMKHKTEKYYIKAFIGELFEARQEITRRKFKGIMDYNLNVVHKNNMSVNTTDTEGYEYTFEVKEEDTYIKYTTTFKYGISAIYLERVVCKVGYCFNS